MRRVCSTQLLLQVSVLVMLPKTGNKDRWNMRQRRKFAWEPAVVRTCTFSTPQLPAIKYLRVVRVVVLINVQLKLLQVKRCA